VATPAATVPRPAASDVRHGAAGDIGPVWDAFAANLLHQRCRSLLAVELARREQTREDADNKIQTSDIRSLKFTLGNRQTIAGKA